MKRRKEQRSPHKPRQRLKLRSHRAELALAFPCLEADDTKHPRYRRSTMEGRLLWTTHFIVAVNGIDGHTDPCWRALCWVAYKGKVIPVPMLSDLPGDAPAVMASKLNALISRVGEGRIEHTKEDERGIVACYRDLSEAELLKLPRKVQEKLLAGPEPEAPQAPTSSGVW